MQSDSPTRYRSKDGCCVHECASADEINGCIDNAIHSAAGLQLREECAKIMRVQGNEEPTGTAKITRAYNLPRRFARMRSQDRRSALTGILMKYENKFLDYLF